MRLVDLRNLFATSGPPNVHFWSVPYPKQGLLPWALAILIATLVFKMTSKDVDFILIIFPKIQSRLIPLVHVR